MDELTLSEIVNMYRIKMTKVNLNDYNNDSQKKKKKTKIAILQT